MVHIKQHVLKEHIKIVKEVHRIPHVNIVSQVNIMMKKE